MTDILAAIDAAVGCQQCGCPLGASPSDDFCTSSCQEDWAAQHVEPLVGYREPWDRPWDFPGVGSDAHQMRRPPAPPEFRLPRSTGNLNADSRAARRALSAATTDEQRAAVQLRIVSLEERHREAEQAQTEAFRRAMEDMAPRVQAVIADMGEWFRRFGEALRPVTAELQRIGTIHKPESTDQRERALAVRRNRNTGPAPRGRAPRSLGRPATTPPGRCGA